MFWLCLILGIGKEILSDLLPLLNKWISGAINKSEERNIIDSGGLPRVDKSDPLNTQVKRNGKKITPLTAVKNSSSFCVTGFLRSNWSYVKEKSATFLR